MSRSARRDTRPVRASAAESARQAPIKRTELSTRRGPLPYLAAHDSHGELRRHWPSGTGRRPQRLALLRALVRWAAGRAPQAPALQLGDGDSGRQAAAGSAPLQDRRPVRSQLADRTAEYLAAARAGPAGGGRERRESQIACRARAQGPAPFTRLAAAARTDSRPAAPPNRSTPSLSPRPPRPAPALPRARARAREGLGSLFCECSRNCSRNACRHAHATFTTYPQPCAPSPPVPSSPSPSRARASTPSSLSRAPGCARARLSSRVAVANPPA